MRKVFCFYWYFVSRFFTASVSKDWKWYFKFWKC